MFGFGLTGDANALLPLLLACAVSHGLSVLMMRRSIMTERIARRGRHVHREYGVDPQERVRVGEVMTRDVRTIPAQAARRAVTAEWFGAAQEHRAFPVVEPGGSCVGMLERERLQQANAGARSAGDLFEADDAVFALPGETCRVAAQRLATQGLERLPVVADLRSRRLVGIVSRSDLVKPVQAQLAEEMHRERTFGWVRRG